MSLNSSDAFKQQSVLIAKGRLTSGNTPLHQRRVHLANAIDDARHTLMTMIANWPNEYELPEGHNVFQLIEVMEVVVEDLVNVETTDAVDQGA